MDGQRQKVGENSVAVQAGGDVNIGMNYTEVKDLIILLFKQNFPKLVDSAAEKAIQNVKEYIASLESRLHQDADKIDFNKFTDPNIQYLLNSTIQNYARKGNSVNMNFLMESFLLTLHKESTSLLDIVSEQVIAVLPKMTKECIDFLTIVQYVHDFKFRGISSIEMSESYSKKIFESLNLNETHNFQTASYLQSLGAFTQGVFARDPYRSLANQYQDFSSNLEKEEWKELIRNNCQYLLKLIEQIESKHLNAMHLTPMGRLIALMNLKTILQMDIDYKIWIK